tara:strand:- start:487 stop:891 length:405 start_codon:yes stop_codon:yes gene_type:complete
MNELKKVTNPKVSVSVGEVFDKITILQIKKDKIKDRNKLININKELNEIETVVEEHKNDLKILPLIKTLKNTNLKLWEIEDKIRVKESLKEFDEDFIQLARSVYIVNDKRAEIKKDINLKTNSNLIEEKSYKQY